MSDARWFEIDLAIDSSVANFDLALGYCTRVPSAVDPADRRMIEMTLMHPTQSGHTSLENALLGILALCQEPAPIGRPWQSDLIRRVAHTLDGRPTVLSESVARAADLTRRFRNVVVHGYDTLDYGRAEEAIDAAGLLVTTLKVEIARFRQVVDP